MEIKNFFKRLQKKIGFFFRKGYSKGHSKLTVMFIPHSHRKIFNFQISNFTILFVLLLTTSIITVSVFAIKNYSHVQRKKEIYENENRNIISRLNQFRNKVQPLNMSTKQVKKSIAHLLKRIGALKGKIRANIPAGGVSIPIPDHILHKSPRFNYDPVVRKLATITYLSDKLGAEMAVIKKHLRHFKRITHEIPSIWPVFGGGYITSIYGPRRSPFTGAREFHTGIDIAAMPGTPIKAAADGNVVLSGFHSGFGNMLEIKHKYGYSTVYAHCMRLNFKTGDRVKKGQVIAYIGRTGAATGYHLHFEVRNNLHHINPRPFMTFDQLN